MWGGKKFSVQSGNETTGTLENGQGIRERKKQTKARQGETAKEKKRLKKRKRECCREYGVQTRPATEGAHVKKQSLVQGEKIPRKKEEKGGD